MTRSTPLARRGAARFGLALGGLALLGAALLGVAPPGWVLSAAAQSDLPAPGVLPVSDDLPPPGALGPIESGPSLFEPASKDDGATNPDEPAANEDGPDELQVPTLDQPAPAAREARAPTQHKSPLAEPRAPAAPTAIEAPRAETRRVEAKPSHRRPDRWDVSENAIPAASGVSSAVPVISLETIGPPEINIGKPCKFVIAVKNIGDAPTHGVSVQVLLPVDVDLRDVAPPAEEIGPRLLEIKLGDLTAKTEQNVVVLVTPRKRGKIELSSRAIYSSLNRLAVQVREPRLTLTVKAPSEANHGDVVPFYLALTNRGDGAAENVKITPFFDNSANLTQTNVPETIEVIPPGDSREFTITAQAKQAGDMKLKFLATGDSGAQAEVAANVTIHRPLVEVEAQGPGLVYLKRSAVFAVLVTNPGDAPARNLRITATLSAGIKVTALDRAADFNKDRNTLTWTLDALEPNGSQVFRYKADAVLEGDHLQEISATADGGLNSRASISTEIVSRPDLAMAVADSAGPIELGQPTEYAILVQNRGTQTATNTVIDVQLPEALEAVASRDYAVEEGKIHFPALNMAPGESKTLRFQAVGTATGDHAVKVRVKADNAPELTVSESSFFYEGKKSRVANRPQ